MTTGSDIRPSAQVGARARNLLRTVNPALAPGAKEHVVEATPPVPPPPAQQLPPPVVDNQPVAADDFVPAEDMAPPAAPEKQVIPKDYVPQGPLDEIDQLIDPKSTTGENFKKLRTKLKSMSGDFKALEDRATKAEMKVKEFDSGLAMPEVNQQQLARIQQLEPFEQLYNLEKSPVYQEKLSRLTAEQAKLKAIADAHGVSEEVVEQAFEAPTDVDRDDILSQHFRNSLGALEAKQAIKSIQAVKKEVMDARTNPSTALSRLQEQNDRIVAEQKLRSRNAIGNMSKQGWIQAREDLVSDARFKAMHMSANDTEHNERYVKPLLMKAGQEFSKTMSILVENGLQNMPLELAHKIAKSDQLAVYSAALTARNEVLERENTELKSLMQRKAAINRPGVSGRADTSSSQGYKPGEGPGAAARGRELLKSVQGDK